MESFLQLRYDCLECIGEVCGSVGLTVVPFAERRLGNLLTRPLGMILVICKISRADLPFMLPFHDLVNGVVEATIIILRQREVNDVVQVC